MTQTEEKDKRIRIFEDYPMPKAVFTLVGPSIIGMLVMMLYNLADTYFVGMLNNQYQTAAVSLVAPVILAFNAVNNFFGIGSSSLMSRSLGMKDMDTVKKSSAFGIWGAIAAGLLFSLAIAVFTNPLLKILGATEENWELTYEYLFYTSTLGAMPSIVHVVMGQMIKAEGSGLQSSIGTISGCLLNVILDPFFILPQYLDMGAAGAGLATFISNCFSCLYFVVIITSKKRHSFVCLNPKYAIPGKRILKEVVKVGLPAAIQNILNVTGMTILNNFAAAFGSDAVSAISISHKAIMLPTYVSMGIAYGSSPIISYNYGSKNYDRARSCVKFTTTIAIILSVILTALFYFFSGEIIGFFMTVESIIAYGTVFIRNMCLAIPFMAMDFIGIGVYQALGKGYMSLFFAIARKIILEIPAIIILNKIWPLYGLSWAQTITEFVLGIVASIVIVRIFRKMGPNPEPEK